MVVHLGLYWVVNSVVRKVCCWADHLEVEMVVSWVDTKVACLVVS